MAINCLIIDDEPVARLGLERYIGKLPVLQLIASVPNPLSALEILKAQKIDLIFLDINMPGMNGIEFLQQYPARPLVIIVTAYSEYAIKGYEFEVVDYLLKPVLFDKFTNAVDKARFKIQQKRQDEENYIFLRTNSKYEKIVFDEVFYIESMLNYVKIITSKRTFIIYSSLKRIEEQFPAAKFLKVHKSFIISRSKVRAIEGNQLYVGEFAIPVSRSYKDDVLKQLLKTPE